jgi:hypothetical protein
MRIQSKAIEYVQAAMVFIAISGCAPTAGTYRTELSVQYDEDFRRFNPPELNVIRNGAQSRAFSQISYDDIWTSALAVAMQGGFIAYADKNRGVISIVSYPTATAKLDSGEFLSLPNAILVERSGNQITVYLNWIDDYFRLSGDSSGTELIVSPDRRKAIGRGMLDRIATQAFGIPKWQWLFVSDR